MEIPLRSENQSSNLPKHRWLVVGLRVGRPAVFVYAAAAVPKHLPPPATDRTTVSRVQYLVWWFVSMFLCSVRTYDLFDTDRSSILRATALEESVQTFTATDSHRILSCTSKLGCC